MLPEWQVGINPPFHRWFLPPLHHGANGSLPISYQDAIPILNALHGQGRKAEEVSADWVGGLGYHGVEYWTGPSEIDLHLVNEVDTVSREI
jgi:hypothetical protein